jgi:hypothetical protein
VNRHDVSNWQPKKKANVPNSGEPGKVVLSSDVAKSMATERARNSLVLSYPKMMASPVPTAKIREMNPVLTSGINSEMNGRREENEQMAMTIKMTYALTITLRLMVIRWLYNPVGLGYNGLL